MLHMYFTVFLHELLQLSPSKIVFNEIFIVAFVLLNKPALLRQNK